MPKTLRVLAIGAHPDDSELLCSGTLARYSHYMDNVSGVEFLPTEYVDITEVIDTKKRMLACHHSQVKAMADLANTDLIDLMLIHSQFRGLAAGCKYAEGFRRLDAYQRGLTRRILP